MAFENFVPTVWNASIDRELERLCVFAEDCNQNYEGTVTKKGEAVTILGVGKPTIKSIARSERNQQIDDAEEIEDTSALLYINEIRYFNYMVGDIDKAQSVGGIMEALEEETSEALASEIDAHIASQVVDESVPVLFKDGPVKVVAGDAAAGEKNVLRVLDAAIQKLYENDVKATTQIVVTISPRFFTLYKEAYIKADTDNSDMLKNGKVKPYGNVIVKLSNNVYRTSDGAVDNIMIRTKRAVAYAKPLTHTEAYRPERRFADAVKGFVLFDAKVVRPKEIVNINVKYE
ncbi:MAG: hypothetical protein IJX38_01255 [Clostridia bacterium]|nr:hypothetical protein [Clostridia bacterium]